jgi:hypothetical protein
MRQKTYKVSIIRRTDLVFDISTEIKKEGEKAAGNFSE